MAKIWLLSPVRLLVKASQVLSGDQATSPADLSPRVSWYFRPLAGSAIQMCVRKASFLKSQCVTEYATHLPLGEMRTPLMESILSKSSMVGTRGLSLADVGEAKKAKTTRTKIAR